MFSNALVIGIMIIYYAHLSRSHRQFRIRKRNLIKVLRAQDGIKISLHWDNRLINFTDTMRVYINYLNVQRAFLLPT